MPIIPLLDMLKFERSEGKYPLRERGFRGEVKEMINSIR